MTIILACANCDLSIAAVIVGAVMAFLSRRRCRAAKKKEGDE